MKKIVVGILSAAFILGAGTAVFAAASRLPFKRFGRSCWSFI